MANKPKIIRFKKLNIITTNNIQDEVNDLIFNILPVDYDNKFSSNLAILCPGNDSYTLNNGKYYCNLFQDIDNDDKTDINANTQKKSFIYKYTKNTKIEYGQFMIYIEEFIITNLEDENNKIRIVKLGIEVGLLISLYNLNNVGNEIKNIRLSGIGTTNITPNERYYLNYFRDLFLHSMVATLKHKINFKDIESIQFCNQKTNQYDINSIDFQETELEECLEYYLYNGNHYLSKFQNIDTIGLNSISHFYFLNDDITYNGIGTFDVTMERIYKNIIVTTNERNKWLKKYNIDKMYSDNKFLGDVTPIITLGDQLNVCPYGDEIYRNLCWLNSTNQFLLAIDEIGNYFIDNTKVYTSGSNQDIFFTNMKLMLKTYKNNFNLPINDRKNGIITGIKNLLDIPIFHNTIEYNNNLGNELEAGQYLELVLGINKTTDTYNDDDNFYKLLVTNMGTTEIRFLTMYYQKLKHKSVTFIGTYLNKFSSIIHILQLLANLKPNQNIITAESNIIDFKKSIYPYLITKKYIIVRYVASANVRLNECYHKIQLINENKYICKALIVKSGNDDSGHYMCYKLNAINNNKYDIYDDIQTNIGNYDVLGHLILLPYTIEYVLYELDVSPIPNDNNNKKSPFDVIIKEYMNLNYVIHLNETNQEQNKYNNINSKDYQLYNILPSKKPDIEQDNLIDTLQEQKQELIEKQSENIKASMNGKQPIHKIKLNNIKDIDETIQLIKQIKYEKSKINQNKQSQQNINDLIHKLNSIKTKNLIISEHLINKITNLTETSTSNMVTLIPQIKSTYKQKKNTIDDIPAIYAHAHILKNTSYVEKILENYKPIDLIPITVLEVLTDMKNKQNIFPTIYFE